MIRSLFYSHYDDEVGFVGFCFVLETGAHCVVLAGLPLTIEGSLEWRLLRGILLVFHISREMS